MINNKDVNYVCMYTLSLTNVVLYFLKSNNAIIYYNKVSLFIKSLIIFVEEKKIISFLEFVLNKKFFKIDDFDKITDYHNIQFDSIEQTSIYANDLTDNYKLNFEYKWIESLIGEIPAKAFLSKYISHNFLYPELLYANSCYKFLKCPENFTVVSNFISSEENFKFFKKNLKNYNVFPLKNNYFRGIIIFFYYSLKFFNNLFKLILSRGITFNKSKKIEQNLMIEFIDPNKFKNGSSYDNDFLIHNNEILKRQTSFFVTNYQYNFLKKNNSDIYNEIKTLSKHYNIIFLNDIKFYFFDFYKLFFRTIKLLFFQIFSKNKNLYSKISNSLVIDYLDFFNLFEKFDFKNLLYHTFPNGHTEFRFNDAIVTSLCRKFDSKSIGMQTRTIYSSKYEDCFDCFDKYLSWGEAWNNVSNLKTLFVDNVINVGCIYRDGLKIINNKDLVNFREKLRNERKYIISVFDSDISPNSHYNWNYSKEFILNVISLAKEFNHCSFIIKPKDNSNTTKYLKDLDISKRLKETENIIFSKNKRNDYKKILNISDIVLAIGFTTPGFEALSLGKRVIYFSLLKNAGTAFKVLPNLISRDYNELKNLFLKSLTDHKNYSKDIKLTLNLLDESSSKSVKNQILINI